jgi:hypothetical protein
MYPKDPDWEGDPARSDWFVLAMSDAAMFHMILCSSALYFELLTGKGNTLERDTHLLAAIQLLNIRLRNFGDAEAISDASIATVAFLAKVEVSLSHILSK